MAFPVAKQVFTMEATNTVVQDILQNSGGTIKVSTSQYPDLNTLDPQFWKYHSIFGGPGNEIILTEAYKICETSQTSEGFFVVIEYRDSTKIKKKSATPQAITPSGCWLQASTMPTCFSRCKVLIQDIQMAPDNSYWAFIVSLTNLPTLNLDWNMLGKSKNCGC